MKPFFSNLLKCGTCYRYIIGECDESLLPTNCKEAYIPLMIKIKNTHKIRQ